MASEAEVERLVVRLLGDGSSFQQMITDALVSAKQIEAAEASMADARKRGEAVTRSVMTTEEAYQDELQQLQQLLESGIISQETYSRAVQKAEDQFVETMTAAKQLEQSISGVSATSQSFVQSIQAVSNTVDQVETQLTEASAAAEEFQQDITAVTTSSQSASQSVQTTATTSQQLGQRLEGLSSQAMRAGTVLTGLGAAVSGVFGSLAYDAVGRANDFETTMISYKAMLGSEVQAQKMLKDLRDFSAKTPFEMPTLLNATKMLLQFQVPANEVLGILKSIGDVTGGSDPGKVMAMSYAFAQMSASGRLMGQDLMQMINAGFNPLSEIAKTSGKSLQELRKEMEQGKITADMVKEAFASASKRLNLMDEQSQSLSGRLSTLKDNFGLLLLEIGTKLTPILGYAIDKVAALVGWLQEASPIVKTVLAVVLGLGTGFGILVASIGGALLTIGALSGAIAAVIGLWGTYTASQTAAATATTVTTAAQTANAAATNMSALASMRAVAATVALRVATLALQGALAVVVAVGFFKLTQALSGAAADYDRLNDEIERNKKLQGGVEQNFTKNTEEIITTVQKTENPEQRARVAQEELDSAIKEVEGYQSSLAGAKQRVKELDTTWNNFTGNKVLDEARREVADVDAMLGAANDRVRQLEQEIQKAQNPLNQAFNTQPLDELEKSLENQIQMFGYSGTEAEIYAMKLKGSTDEQLAYAISMQEQLDQMNQQAAEAERLKQQQQQLNDAVSSFTTSLQDQVQTFHMTSTEAAIYRLRMQGATEDQVRAARAAADELDALNEQKKAQEESNRMMDEGKKLMEQYLPVEKKLEKAQKELTKLLEMGAIDQETYGKATKDLEEQFKGLEGQFNKEYKADLSVTGVDAVAADSAEAMARLEEYYMGSMLRTKPKIKAPEIETPETPKPPEVISQIQSLSTPTTIAPPVVPPVDIPISTTVEKPEVYSLFSQFENLTAPAIPGVEIASTIQPPEVPKFSLFDQVEPGSLVAPELPELDMKATETRLNASINNEDNGWNAVVEKLDVLIGIEEKKNPVVLSEAGL